MKTSPEVTWQGVKKTELDVEVTFPKTSPILPLAALQKGILIDTNLKIGK